VVVLRATHRVLRLIAQSSHRTGASDTALGDWYVNRIVIDRQPLLLLVSARSLLSALVPARDVRGLPARLAAIVVARLRRLGIDDAVLAAEFAAMSVVVVAKTSDRSVTGQMVDFAKVVPYLLPENGRTETDLHAAEDELAETPCRSSGPFEKVIWPRQAALSLLNSTWSGHGVVH
jgi:hypothetical protein